MKYLHLLFLTGVGIAMKFPVLVRIGVNTFNLSLPVLGVVELRFFLFRGDKEVGVVYFRTAYAPEQYESDEVSVMWAWQMRGWHSFSKLIGHVMEN